MHVTIAVPKRITHKWLHEYVAQVNAQLKDVGNPRRFVVEGRNNYTAVDEVDNRDGASGMLCNIQCGTPRDCYEALERLDFSYTPPAYWDLGYVSFQPSFSHVMVEVESQDRVCSTFHVVTEVNQRETEQAIRTAYAMIHPGEVTITFSPARDVYKDVFCLLGCWERIFMVNRDGLGYFVVPNRQRNTEQVW